MLKRPVVNMNLTFCLTKDDMDLWVTICHIREECRLSWSSHFDDFSDLSCCCHCQLPNLILISLPMHCITPLLTSLISQALLQAALDKESRVLHGWLLLCEFLSLTVARSTATLHAMTTGDCQSIALALPVALPVWFQDCQQA
jgi:hypothetical protein